MTKIKKIYALGIGIDAYPQPVPPLNGCKRDIALIEQYLMELPNVSVSMEKLLDEEATKANIVDKWRAHLGRAEEGDTALLYFSGHGTTELADPIFWKSNPDRVIQGIIPFDGVTLAGDEVICQLLADKEWRFLIHELSQRNPHIVTIFDCCHSGLNTRPAYKKRQFPQQRSGELVALPMRDWKDFIFADDHPKERIANKQLQQWLPEGSHIQIAACLPDESAYEVEGNGVFTAKLLEVLRRSKGQITYFDLQSRIRHFLRGYFNQTPQFYVTAKYADQVYKRFLDLPFDGPGREVSANVIISPNGQWFMDMGHLHGISKLAQTVTLTDDVKGQTYEAWIGDIEASRTELLFRGQTPDPEGHYQAFVKRFLSAPVKVFLEDQSTNADPASVLAFLQSRLGHQIIWTNHPFEALYRLLITEEQISITPAEGHTRHPVVPNSSRKSTGAMDQAIVMLNHIGQWHFVKDLHNPNAFLFQSAPIKLELIQILKDGSSQIIPHENGYLNTYFEEQRPNQWGGHVKIKLTNRWDRSLYVSLLYLSMNYQIYGRLLASPVVKLNAGQSIWARDGQTIPLKLEDQVRAYNEKYSNAYFKIIASTEYFDVTTLEQDPLPSPVGPPTRAGRKPKTRQEGSPNAADWITRDYVLRLRNPYYEV